MAWIFGGASSFNNGGSSDINSWNVGRVGSFVFIILGASLTQSWPLFIVAVVLVLLFTILSKHLKSKIL